MNISNIDENMQSRAIATFGLENIKKFSKLKIFIYGVNGISLEASKNLILTGIKSLSIFDERISKAQDFSWNFFLNEKDINMKRRDETIISNLRELNEYVDVFIENNLQTALNNNDIIVVSEIKHTEEINKINDFCRTNKKGFLYAGLFGLTGFIFSDFCEHNILDEDGEPNQKLFISSIKQNINEHKIEFTVIKDENDGIDNEKYVIFKEIEGMEQLNNLQPTKIYKLDNNRYYINYNERLNNYIKGGIIEEIKLSQKMNYKSYKEYMENPNEIYELDGSKKDRNCLIHCFILSIQKFYDENKKLPEINNEQQSEGIKKIAEEFYISFKKKENQLFKKSKVFDYEFIKKLSMIAECQLPTDSSFLGGILAQEILKYSGLYKPLNQILYYNNFVTIENLNKTYEEMNKFEKDRYYYESIIYGKKTIKKLKNLNIFIIGAGALGCEVMKILALMGSSTGENSKIIITDNDSIELSNLNRQFFFKKKHIGENKAKICCEEVKKINPKINCIGLDKLVNRNSEDFFIDEFWTYLDIVILAVDNISARKYIDNKCTAYNIKLIEIGTQGVNASSSLIIPQMTSCYNDIKLNSKKEIPQCTLKYYPLTNIHCIEYAKQKFDDFFHYNIKDVLEYHKLNFNFIDENREIMYKLKNIRNIIEIFKNKNFDNCLNLAIDEFYRYFNYNIRDLLNDFPPNLKKKDGTLFWNGDKRMPKEIYFDAKDNYQIDFIYFYAYLMAKSLKIKIKDKNYARDYIAKNLIEIQNILTKKEILEQINKLKDENEKELDSLNLDEFSNIDYEEFEKDNDSNHHVDFLTAFSNLRAKNYGIENSDRNLVKFIAGKIIPAISTTTASVCGFMMSQIYVLIRDNYNIQNLRKINFSLSYPFINIAKPTKPIIISNKLDENTKFETKVPFDFNVWDKIEIKGNLTTNELTDKLIKQFNIVFDFDGLYDINDFALIHDEKDKEKLIEDIYFSNIPKDSKINNISIKQIGISENKIYGNIYLKYFGAIGDKITILFPIIKYNFKKDKNVAC